MRNFFKIAKQNENEFSQESTTVRLIESRCNKLEIKKIINNEGKFQMNEMITVSIINSSNNTNQIKIILHIPSLKTFVIRVIFLKTVIILLKFIKQNYYYYF